MTPGVADPPGPPSAASGVKHVTEPVPPVLVTLVGTGDGGSPPTPTGTVLVTPDSQPNVILTVVTPIVAILIRASNAFCVSLAGSLMAGGLTQKVLPHDTFLDLVYPSIFLAGCIAGVGILKDSATVFSGLEKKFPLATGSV